MKSYIPLIFDTIFSLFLSFIICFIFVNGFIIKPYSYVVSLMVACLFSLISFKILSNRKNRREQKTHRNAEYENAMLQFSFMPKVDTCNFFKKTLENIGYKTEKRRSSLKIKDKNALLVFNFGFDQVSKTDVVKAYNLKTLKDTVYLIAENFNTEVKNFASRFYNLVLVDGEKIYSFLKEHNSLPQIKYSFKEKRLDKIKALKSLLNRKNFKRFAIFGITFLTMSYFVPIKLYYVIVGGLFCLFSLLCLLFGKTESAT